MLGPDTNMIRVLQWNYERDPELRGLEPREVTPRLIKTSPQLIETTCSSCGATYKARRAASAERPSTFSLIDGVLQLRCSRCKSVTDLHEWVLPEPDVTPPSRSDGWP